jgi:protein-L-isoaspartate(D-aspartate) O-methyltransferase
MVQRQLRARGVLDERVLNAMLDLPREEFLPERLRAAAYEDTALPLNGGSGATVSQPYMVGAMTQALDLKPTDRVLEVGTGSGYQTAVLASLALEVYTVERVPELQAKASELLGHLGFGNVHYRVGDGSEGWPEHSPFDAILVTAGAPVVPGSLRGQLSPYGGRMVIPVGPRTLQELRLVIRDGDRFTSDHLMNCRFVPLLGEEGW